MLRKALKENNEQIEAYSRLGVQLTCLLSVPIQRAYNNSFDQLLKEFDDAKTDAARRKVVQTMVAQNDSMIQRWELFGQLDALYSGLPKAHAELSKAVEGEGGFSAVIQLAQSAERLHKIYEGLREANEKAAKDAEKNNPHPNP